MSSAAASGGHLISVHPPELKFLFELEKQSYCDLKVVNNTEKHVAFKVKTTSPKKYFVRPNTGVIQPWDSSIIRVTLQAQREYPPDMQCKDKFLLQSTVVPPHSDVDELPAETFTKESGKVLEECKLKVVYLPPGSNGNSEEGVRGFGGGPDANNTLQQLREERDAAFRQTKQLQQELATFSSHARTTLLGLSSFSSSSSGGCSSGGWLAFRRLQGRDDSHFRRRNLSYCQRAELAPALSSSSQLGSHWKQ